MVEIQLIINSASAVFLYIDLGQVGQLSDAYEYARLPVMPHLVVLLLALCHDALVALGQQCRSPTRIHPLCCTAVAGPAGQP